MSNTNEKLSDASKNKLKNLFDDEENESISTDSSNVIEVPNMSKEDRLSNIFDGIDQEASKNIVVDVAKEAMLMWDKKPAKEKIQELYDKAMTKAKIKDPDEILTTYIEDLYNPATSKLDTANLLFNLMLLTKLMDLDIMDFHFDEDMNKPNEAQYSLSHQFWNNIMTAEGVDTETKHSNVLMNNFTVMFFSAMFQSIVGSADKTAYNETKRKWDMVLADDDALTLTLEEGVLNFIKNKSVDNSVIMITPDLTPYIKLDEVNTESFDPDAQIKPLGKWENRFIYEINVSKIAYLKGFKRGAFFIKAGNKYIVNPEKPLGYMHVIDNPFLQKPSLKMFINMDFKFFNSAATFLRINDL